MSLILSRDCDTVGLGCIFQGLSSTVVECTLHKRRVAGSNLAIEVVMFYE